jgi:hypothetical protein
MKKFFLVMACVASSAAVIAQDEETEEKRFSDNLFIGGSVTISFFSGQTVLGANPMFGYKIADWVDAGIIFNYLYSTMRDAYQYDDQIKQTTLGPGVFMRLYPVNILFIQGQFERNFITQKYFPPGNGPVEKSDVDVNSFLVGGGLAQGRQKGGTTFYYISVLFDVLKDEFSPYTNVSVNPNNPSQRRVDIVPIIRAGVNIGLGRNR